MNADFEAQLKAAYDQSQLKQLGISFETAANTPMFAICLSHMAKPIAKPYVPLPKHAVTPPRAYKDE